MLPLLLAVAGVAGPPCARLPPGEAHFVIVGRNAPPTDSGLAALEYADDDARRMYAAATEQMCFRPDQITLLVDEAASSDRVVEALAAHAYSRPGRFFVYVSAHGSRGEGVQLDVPLSWDALHAGIEAVGARQTFVFLDTCDSGSFLDSLTGNARGMVQLAPRVDEGRFYLTASNGRAFETHLLGGGRATSDFLGIVHGQGMPDEVRVINSNDVCRVLTAQPELTGECEQRIRGGEGVILVPERRQPGWLQIDEHEAPGRWSYVLDAGDDGVVFPIRVIDLGDTTARRSDGLPPGDYRLRRVRRNRRQCDVAQVTIASGRVSTVQPVAWSAEAEHCKWLEERESRVPRMGAHGLALGIGLASPWTRGVRSDAFLRVSYHWWDAPGYRLTLNAWVGWLLAASNEVGVRLLSASDGADLNGVEGEELGVGVAWAPWSTRMGFADAYAGVETGMGWVSTYRLSGGQESGWAGTYALQPGMIFRVTDEFLVDLQGLFGFRIYRWHDSVRVGLRADLTISGVVGWH